MKGPVTASGTKRSPAPAMIMRGFLSLIGNQPHIGFFKHLFQHAIQLFPITFAGIASQAIRLHRLNLHLCIGKDLVYSLGHFGMAEA